MLRIDCHTHGGHAERGPDGKLQPPLMLAWNPGEWTPERYLQSSREQGVDRIVMLDAPEITFGLKAVFGDYIIPVPMIDLDIDTPQTVDSLFDRGAVGIKCMAPRQSYGAESYWPIYDVVRSRGGMVTFHTGYLGLEIYEPGGLHQRTHVVDITHMRPASIDRIGRVFPDLRIVMAHFGNPWWDEAFCVIRAHRNIYADFSGGTCLRQPLDCWGHLFAPDGRPDTKALAKLCFGTDAMYCQQQQNDGSTAAEITGFAAEITGFYERFLDYAQVPEEIRKGIWRETILQLTTPNPT